MSVPLSRLVAEADALLQPQRFTDYCPNGLQVAGRDTVALLVSGVTACLALIEAAAELRADALLVHHGYFWRGEDPRIVGMKKARLAALLRHDISLLGYHLPLDAHPELGNNAQLAKRLDLIATGTLSGDGDAAIGNVGHPREAVTGGEFAERLRQRLGREPLHVGDGDAPVRRIAWCTGAAQSMIDRAAALGADTYLTGEVSEQTVHVAREHGMQFFAAGHHASERYGAAALGERLGHTLGIQHRFVDIDNPA